MRLSMLKLLTITSLLSISANAAPSNIEKKLFSYEKQRVSANPAVQIKDLKLAFSKKLENNWTGYLFTISLVYQGKNVTTNDVLFSNGTEVTGELKKLTGFDYKRMMHPTLSAQYYDKKRLIAGNQNAKNKLVVFSDPLCPNCTSTMPELIDDVRKNPNLFALYYYSFPLDMHPTAKTIAKASKLAEAKGIKDVTYKLYTGNFDKFFDPYELKDNQKALDSFNKVFKTSFSMNEVNNSAIENSLADDMKMADKAYVNGTPSLFLNGEIDVTRSNYKRMIK